MPKPKNQGSRQGSTTSSALDRLRGKKDGVIAQKSGQFAQIIVAKQANELLLLFCPLGVPLSNSVLSGVMARLDLSQPTVLKGVYTQAMLASLVFHTDPQRVYIVGAGGGRLALALRHFRSNCCVEGAECDPDVLALSRRYFGLKPGPHLQIACADGRHDLAARLDGRYDHIYIDCFGADGRIPQALSTQDFYQMVAQKLAPTGVATVNLVDAQPEFQAQRAGFVRCFDKVWSFEHDGTHVLFGTKSSDLTHGELITRARTMAMHDTFGFDLAGRVGNFTQINHLIAGAVAPLRDGKT